jgi:hypothetical protein
MNVLNIEASEDTPSIILNKEEEIFEICGRSLPEDSPEFYRPVLAWIEEYKKDPNPETHFAFKLEYANTASSKLIQVVLKALEDLKGATAIWYYEADDEDMEEMGNEFSGLADIRFELRTYEK